MLSLSSWKCFGFWRVQVFYVQEIDNMTGVCWQLVRMINIYRCCFCFPTYLFWKLVIVDYDILSWALFNTFNGLCRLSKQQPQSSMLEINWLLVKSDLLRQGRSVVSDYVVTTDRDLKSLSLSLLWILVWAVYNLTFCKRLRPHSGGFSTIQQTA